VGQSSWGPAVFAFVEDEVRGESLVHRLREQFGLPNDAVLLTRARNRGASLDSGDGHAHRLC
jgi:predicted sugar kinase